MSGLEKQLFSIFALIVLALPAAASPAPAVIRPPRDVPPGLVAPHGKGVVRSRLVRIDLGPMWVAKRIGLDLFDDAQLAAVVRTQRRMGRAVVFEGEIEGEAGSSVALSVLDGQMFGNVKSGSRWYQIRYAGGNVHAVVEMDESRLGRGLDPLMPPASPPAIKAAAVVANDDGSIIDVLVLYTPNAKVAVGGATAIANVIHVAVAETNTAYANSGVNQRLRLVHTAETADWFEGGSRVNADSFSFSTALTYLQANGDGAMDDAHSLRNTYGADAVALIFDRGGACGIAYVMRNVSADFEDAAFSVTDWACATGYYSFGHELGHNMGLAHDRDNVGTAGAFSYAYGWQDPGSAFRTIMAYACPIGPCPRVQHFSNPDVVYMGMPTGSPRGTATEAHNAMALNNTAMTFANFRASVVPAVAPPANVVATATVPAAGPPVVGVTWSASAGALSYEISRRGAAADFAVIGTSGGLSFVDETAERDRAYIYRVRALTDLSSSDPGAGDLTTTVFFSDDPIGTGLTVVKAAHLVELRDAVDAVRSLAGVGPAFFADTPAPGLAIRAVHVTELRTALDDALIALAIPTSGYSAGATTGTAIAAAHYQELRARTR